MRSGTWARRRYPSVRARQLFVPGSWRPTGEFRPHRPGGTVRENSESRGSAHGTGRAVTSSRQKSAPAAPAHRRGREPMAYKQVLFRFEAREKILRGVNALADAVRVTLGPKSKCVLIQKRFGTPLVCNDGVTIAKEMELEGPRREPRRPDDPAGGRAHRRRRRATAPARRPSSPTPSSPTACATSSPAPAPSTSSAGSTAGVRSRVEAVRGAVPPGQEPPGEGAGRHHLRPQRRRRSASSSPTRWRRSATRASSPSRSRRPRRRSSRSSRACSSTAATSRPTSSPTPRRWRPCSRTSGSCSPTGRSAS